MASISDALANASEVGGESTAEFYVDGDLRTISVPSDGVVLGVAGDVEVNTVRFSVPQTYRGCDLSGFEPRVNYVNANGDASFSIGSNVKVANGRITFDWLVPEPATRYEGAAMVAVCMREVVGETVTRDYNATPASVTVLHGIHPERQVGAQEQADIIAAVTAEATANIQPLATAAAESATEAQTSATAAAESATDAKTVVGGVTASLAGKADLKSVQLPTSGSANKGKWIKFGEIDLSGGGSYECVGALLTFARAEGKSPQGSLFAHVRLNGSGAIGDTYAYWVALDNWNFYNSVALKNDGKVCSLYYRPVVAYESPVVALTMCSNASHISIGVSGGWESDIGTHKESAVSATANWGNIMGKPSTYPPATHTHPEYLPKAGGTMTGPLVVNGTTASHPIVTRGITGSDGNGNAGELYLNYDANAPIVLGTGKHRISADGGTYDGTAAKANLLTKEGFTESVALLTDARDAVPTDSDYYLCQYAGGDKTNLECVRRPMTRLWEYIRAKCDARYQLKE